MIEKQELKGEWNISGKSESFNGILTFDPINGSKLEIFGTFGSGFPGRSAGVIQGKTTSGWVTLLDSHYQSGQHSNVTSTSISVYRPGIILLGYQFNNKEEIQFNSAHFTLFNLLEWININAIQLESREKNHSLEYKKPADINFDCYPGCKGKIEFTLDGQNLNRQYQMNIDQRCKVIFEYEGFKSLNNILHDIFTFLGFITFCTYEQSYPMEIVFFNENIKDEFISKSLKRNIPQSIKCIYKNSYYNPEYKKREVYQHLIKYDNIVDSFSGTITEWFKQATELEQVLQLLLRAFVDKHDFSTEKFMDAIRAVEIFHRMSHNNEVVSKEELKFIKNAIEKTDLSSKQKDFVKEKLNFAHEPTLKQRLEEMVNLYAFPYFNERVPDKISFIKNAKDSRNYYTHFDKSLEKKALIGKNLFDLTENINLILFSAILKRIGIQESVYDQSARYLIYS